MQETKKSVLVTYPQQQLEDNTQKAFVGPSLNRVEEEEEKNNIRNYKAFCVTRKRNKRKYDICNAQMFI